MLQARHPTPYVYWFFGADIPICSADPTTTQSKEESNILVPVPRVFAPGTLSNYEQPSAENKFPNILAWADIWKRCHLTRDAKQPAASQVATTEFIV